VKIHYAVPLAVAIGLGFGAVAIRGLHARTTTPPVYVVVEIDEITDANSFEALRQTADVTAVEVQSEDGRYFARTENVTALDGSAPKFFAFIAFDNMTKAKAFNDSMKKILRCAPEQRSRGHSSSRAQCANQCPLFGEERTSTGGNPMSAFDPKRTSVAPRPISAVC
jgi:uncharacterized protein (DUF1330 family)